MSTELIACRNADILVQLHLELKKAQITANTTLTAAAKGYRLTSDTSLNVRESLMTSFRNIRKNAYPYMRLSKRTALLDMQTKIDISGQTN